MNAVQFEPDYHGILFVEWQSKSGRHYHRDINTRKLSRTSFKRLVRWIIASRQWYQDSRWDSYSYDTVSYATEDITNLPLSSMEVARWLIWTRNS